MNNALSTYISRYIHLTHLELAGFDEYFIESTFKKNQFLLQEDQICTQQFFILKGLISTFYIDATGNEKIISFGKEHCWVTDMDSFIHQTPSGVRIQALEKTRVLTISKDKW